MDSHFISLGQYSSLASSDHVGNNLGLMSYFTVLHFHIHCMVLHSPLSWATCIAHPQDMGFASHFKVSISCSYIDVCIAGKCYTSLPK